MPHAFAPSTINQLCARSGPDVDEYVCEATVGGDESPAPSSPKRGARLRGREWRAEPSSRCFASRLLVNSQNGGGPLARGAWRAAPNGRPPLPRRSERPPTLSRAADRTKVVPLIRHGDDFGPASIPAERKRGTPSLARRRNAVSLSRRFWHERVGSEPIDGLADERVPPLLVVRLVDQTAAAPSWL